MIKIILSVITIILFVSSDLISQKVKYKKGKVLVNKEHKYNFEKLENKDSKRTLDSYILKDLNGNAVMSLTDTVFYLEQLPNETNPRIGYEAYKCESGDGNFFSVIPYVPIIGYPKQRVKDLTKVGFFANGNFNQEIFEKFIDRQYPDQVGKGIERLSELNENRINNYQSSVDLLGELLERDPHKPFVVINTKKSGDYLIKEGGQLLAKVNLREKGSHNHSYTILNHNDVKLGEINIFQNPETKNLVERMKYNVKLFALDNKNSPDSFKWFYEKVSSVGPPTSSVQTKIVNIANYLVENGFL